MLWTPAMPQGFIVHGFVEDVGFVFKGCVGVLLGVRGPTYPLRKTIN